jgi:hypothetical protein
MQKQQAFLVFVVAGLVVAVTLLVFQARALTFKIQALEARQPEKQVASQGVRPAPAQTLGDQLEVEPQRSAPVQEKAPRPSGAPIQPVAPADSVLAKTLTPAQEEAVSRSVDRILNEKYGHLPKSAPHEPLEKILERELNLTASQKERITALLKKKDEELAATHQSGNPFSGKNLQKAMDLNARYETLIKNELDANQQAKYDQLKKEGKINNGITINITANEDEE